MAYLGPGDIVASAGAWVGTRAYSAAKAASAPYHCFTLSDSSGANSVFIDIVGTNGGLDYVTLNNWIVAHGTPRVDKWWDQSGNGQDLTQGTLANRPSVIVSTGSGSDLAAIAALVKIF
jgi:hypothetical protein